MTVFKNLSLCFLFFILTNLLAGQSVIKLDFKNKTIDPKAVDTLKSGDTYQVEVDSINLNLFQVKITAADTTYSSKIPFPTFNGLKLDGLTDLLSNITTGSIKTISKQITSTEEKEQEETPVEVLEGAYIPDDNNSCDSIAQHKKLHAQKGDFLAFQDSLTHKVKNIRALKSEVELEVLNSLKLIADAQTLHANEVSKRLDDIEKKIFDNKNIIAQKKLELLVSVNICPDSSRSAQDDNLLNLLIQMADSSSNKFDKLLEVINAENEAKLVKPLIRINNSKGKYLSFPIEMKSEKVDLRIDFIPRDTTLGIQPYFTEIEFPNKPKSFSGVGSGFYIAWLTNESISFNQDTTGAFRGVLEDDADTEFGAMVPFVYGTQIGDENNFGFNLIVAPGISIGRNIKPRFLFGGGLSLGNKHKVQLNGGLIAGYVDRVSNILVSRNNDSKNLLDKVFESVPENDGIITQLNIGGFASFSYTFIF